MSKRITTQTEINDFSIAEAALKGAKIGFTTAGSRITITSGPLRGAHINTSTGDIDRDDMFNPTDAVDNLKQMYAETKIRFEVAKNGGTFVGERQVHKDGTIELVYQIG